MDFCGLLQKAKAPPRQFGGCPPLFYREPPGQFQPLKFTETKDTVRVSLQEYLFTGSSKVSSCGFWQKRVRLSDLLEGGLTVLQEPTLTVLLDLPPKWKLAPKRDWRPPIWVTSRNELAGADFRRFRTWETCQCSRQANLTEAAESHK